MLGSNRVRLEDNRVPSVHLREERKVAMGIRVPNSSEEGLFVIKEY